MQSIEYSVWCALFSLVRVQSIEHATERGSIRLMVHLSKRELPEAQLNDIKEQLVGLLFAQTSRGECRTLAHELFGRTEFLMLAKRVAAIGLLERGYSAHTVAELLCMSAVTVGKLREDMDDREMYTHIRKTLRRKGARQSAIKMLESLLTYGGASRELNKQLRTNAERWSEGA